MINLLNANFVRLKKSKLFLVMSLAIVVVALLFIYNQYEDVIEHSVTVVYLDNLFTLFLIFVGVIISIFTCLFLGFEYQDGTIDNKIVIGHKRVNIYLANLITIILVSLFFELLYMIVISIIAIPLFGLNIANLEKFIYIIFMTLLIILANASIYTLIAIVCSSSAAIIVLCLLISFGSFFATLGVMGVLDIQEYVTISRVSNYETGEISYEQVKNPDYPSEFKRTVCKTLMNIIPEAESIQLSMSDDYGDLNLLPLYSLSTTIICNCVGILVFRKKELK